MKKIKIMVVALGLSGITSLSAQVINVNDIRNFTVDGSTQIKVDGVSVSEFPFEIIGTGGFKARFTVDTDVNSTISQGTITEISIINDIKGPVTSLNPLQIMDQDVFVTGDTVLQNLAAVGNLNLGDLVAVSGSISETNNSMQLTRLELLPSLSEWKLRGFARNITAGDFTIGNLTINRNAVTPVNCASGFIENTFVSLVSNPDTDYVNQQNGLLSTLTGIECEPPDVDNTPGNNFIPVVLEGFVSEIIDFSSVRINGLTVYFDGTTEFDNGEIEHLDVNTKVEVQGLRDTDSDSVIADTIRFLDFRIKADAPVQPADVNVNQSIVIFDKVILVTPETQDEDGIIGSGLLGATQVEVRGFIDSQGQMYAQRVRERGVPDFDDVKLRGIVDSVTMPHLTINGVDVDGSSSVFEIQDQIVDMVTFFNQLQEGMQASVSDAHYDDVGIVLSGGIIELIELETEDDPDSVSEVNKQTGNTVKEIIGTGGVGFATITGTELIFRHSFEQGELKNR